MIDHLLRSQRFVLGAVFVSLALVGLGAGYMTGGGEAGSSLPPAPDAPQAYVRGTVQSLDGDKLTLATPSGPHTLKLGTDATVETLQLVDAASLAKGDWVNGGAVRNTQTVFAVTALVVIRQAQLGVVR